MTAAGRARFLGKRDSTPYLDRRHHDRFLAHVDFDRPKEIMIGRRSFTGFISSHLRRIPAITTL
jgi:alpha-D-ribose 1-methylphosphonate 5-triphosphate synthase subunit PhnL